MYLYSSISTRKNARPVGESVGAADTQSKIGCCSRLQSANAPSERTQPPQNASHDSCVATLTHHTGSAPTAVAVAVSETQFSWAQVSTDTFGHRDKRTAEHLYGNFELLHSQNVSSAEVSCDASHLCCTCAATTAYFGALDGALSNAASAPIATPAGVGGAVGCQLYSNWALIAVLMHWVGFKRFFV